MKFTEGEKVYVCSIDFIEKKKSQHSVDFQIKTKNVEQSNEKNTYFPKEGKCRGCSKTDSVFKYNNKGFLDSISQSIKLCLKQIELHKHKSIFNVKHSLQNIEKSLAKYLKEQCKI